MKVWYEPTHKEKIDMWNSWKQYNGYSCSNCDLKEPKYSASFGDGTEVCYRCFMAYDTFWSDMPDDYKLKPGEWVEGEYQKEVNNDT